jgi:hypothetical protein
MKTTLMWTINDFSAYEMVFGWSTHEKFACSYHSFETRPGQVIGSRVRWVDPDQPKKKKTADNYSIKWAIQKRVNIKSHSQLPKSLAGNLSFMSFYLTEYLKLKLTVMLRFLFQGYIGTGLQVVCDT